MTAILGQVPIVYDPRIHNRRSIRLQHYDYSLPGAYFITICTKERRLFFDKGSLRTIAEQCWTQIPAFFPRAEMDKWVVMPNHVHGIIALGEPEQVDDAPSNRPRLTRDTSNRMSVLSPYRATISAIVRAYKGAVTSQCRKAGHIDFAWQRNFFDRIIRTEMELYAARQYIIDNPANWEKDAFNPKQ